MNLNKFLFVSFHSSQGRFPLIIDLFQMETKILRVKPFSFKDSSKKSLNQTLFHYKKLTELPLNDSNDHRKNLRTDSQ